MGAHKVRLVPNKRIVTIFFISLTVFSAILLGYSLYTILGIRWATKSIQVSIKGADIDLERSEVTFHVVFRNTVNVFLSIKYVKADIFLNNKKVQTMEYGYSDPMWLPTNVDKELFVIAKIDDLNTSASNVWKLNFFIIFLTSLPQQASVTRSISYGG